MTDALRTKIESEVDETAWDALVAHAARGALFVVHESVGLSNAALAVATNRTPIVAHWIEQGLLARPSAETMTGWDAEPGAHRFRVVIVQPYVLVSPVVST